jgi:hypothetical protein
MLLITPQAHEELEPQAGVSPASSALQVRRIVGSATAAKTGVPAPTCTGDSTFAESCDVSFTTGTEKIRSAGGS